MKKLSAFVLVIFLMLSFSCCSPAPPEDSADTGINESKTEDIREESADLSALTLLSPTDSVPSRRYENENIVQSVVSFADRMWTYVNATQMLNDRITDAVIEGEVLSAEFMDQGSSAMIVSTRVVIRVDHVYKGDLKPGETIFLSESGGFVPAKYAYDIEVKGKFPDAPEYDGSDEDVWEYRQDGQKASEPGERAIFFLSKNIWKDPEAYEFVTGSPDTDVYVAISDKYKFVLANPGQKVAYNDAEIPSEEAYMLFLTRGFEDFPDPVFTLSDFEKFAEENLGKTEVNFGYNETNPMPPV